MKKHPQNLNQKPKHVRFDMALNQHFDRVAFRQELACFKIQLDLINQSLKSLEARQRVMSRKATYLDEKIKLFSPKINKRAWHQENIKTDLNLKHAVAFMVLGMFLGGCIIHQYEKAAQSPAQSFCQQLSTCLI